MSDMYTKHALKYAKVVKDNIYNARLERPSTQALLDDVAGKNVVDMGCGSGVYAEWFLNQRVNQLTCVDLSPEMVSIVEHTYGDRVKAYCQDLSAGLPKEADNSADVIVSPLVLHYIQDLFPVFKEVYRVLKPGGYLVFSTHHPFADFECSTSGNYFEQERIEEDWGTIGEPVTVRFYRRSLSAICQGITDAGLVITKISEGEVDDSVKALDPSRYQHLKNHPNFIFFRCEKPNT